MCLKFTHRGVAGLGLLDAFDRFFAWRLAFAKVPGGHLCHGKRSPPGLQKAGQAGGAIAAWPTFWLGFQS